MHSDDQNTLELKDKRYSKSKKKELFQQQRQTMNFKGWGKELTHNMVIRQITKENKLISKFSLTVPLLSETRHICQNQSEPHEHSQG